ncbi:hypothetical protein H6G80_03935 [Nostoc sp. FACHB-87]|uniref:hypothetical protein n=1 Tax=Nostocaceae TaxID=1162 RepID=UPI001684887B|nr:MULTISPECIES: hypothetical protein [Nostocaceae]MBD2298947.1 hypothetical protein [Nostoc sp. FACHB-190]MBD2453225.1 hypothetical protein [Nostoc sp. FACHB-87]MBD2474995.1 hypothetical protein [Anabaena sp. FACHB-83]
MNPNQWNTLDDINYVRECLEHCKDSSMLQELREIFSPELLKKAAVVLSSEKKSLIKQWVLHLNQLKTNE